MPAPRRYRLNRAVTLSAQGLEWRNNWGRRYVRDWSAVARVVLYTTVLVETGRYTAGMRKDIYACRVDFRDGATLVLSTARPPFCADRPDEYVACVHHLHHALRAAGPSDVEFLAGMPIQPSRRARVAFVVLAPFAGALTCLAGWTFWSTFFGVHDDVTGMDLIALLAMLLMVWRFYDMGRLLWTQGWPAAELVGSGQSRYAPYDLPEHLLP